MLNYGPAQIVHCRAISLPLLIFPQKRQIFDRAVKVIKEYVTGGLSVAWPRVNGNMIHSALMVVVVVCWWWWLLLL